VGLKLYFISIAFSGLNTLITVFFTSIEKALPAQILSVLRGLVLIIPLTFLFAAIWQMTGIWLAYPITEILVALLGVVMYFKQRNKT
jgi:Na+-driven multidrug efflux pump